MNAPLVSTSYQGLTPLIASRNFQRVFRAPSVKTLLDIIAGNVYFAAIIMAYKHLNRYHEHWKKVVPLHPINEKIYISNFLFRSPRIFSLSGLFGYVNC